MKIAEHCKNCMYCLDYVNAGIGSKIMITKEKKIHCTYGCVNANWHPFLVLCNHFADNRITPILKRNIRSCSEFKVANSLNENIWVDIYAKEN